MAHKKITNYLRPHGGLVHILSFVVEVMGLDMEQPPDRRVKIEREFSVGFNKKIRLRRIDKANKKLKLN